MKKIAFGILSSALLLPLAALAQDDSYVALTNPLASDDIRVIIGYIIKAALGFSGTLALVMVIWGGFLWLTSQGNAEKIEKGKAILLWATIGLIVIFFAYTIVSAVITTLTSAA